MSTLHAKSNGVKIYLGQKMTGRFQDEMRYECDNAIEKLEYAGFTVLSPVVEENIKPVHEVLQNDMTKLKGFWKRDKEMLREAHIMLDLNSQGTSDGVNVEMGYTRFYMYKPLVRVHPTLGCVISKIEYDCVAKTLDEAIEIMLERWGTKHKLLFWRLRMMSRCIWKFTRDQIIFMWRCI